MREIPLGQEKLNIGKQIIVFIGPEGSGKTTTARRLCEETGKPYITTGNIIRDLAANNPGELGDSCRAMFTEQRYLDGATLIKILLNRIKQDDTAGGFILDGGMRTVEETQGFQSMLESANRCLPLMVVHLHIPGWMSFERLVSGPEARKRKDDTHDYILNRLSKYYLHLGQRVGIIKQQPSWELIHVDATKPKDDVYRQLTSHFNG